MLNMHYFRLIIIIAIIINSLAIIFPQTKNVFPIARVFEQKLSNDKSESSRN